MQFKKTIISLLLLLTYSLGFAHNLALHCQEVSHLGLSVHQEEENHHHHKHHQHSPDENINSDHEHILHEDHYDESLYDLVLCFLNEIEHPAEECNVQHYLPAKTNNVSKKDLAKVKLIVILFSISIDVRKSEIATDYAPNIRDTFSSPPLEQAPYRGPPSFTS